MLSEHLEFKMPKISYSYYKILLLSSIYNKCGREDEQIFKEEESIKIFKSVALITDIEEYQKIYNHT